MKDGFEDATWQVSGPVRGFHFSRTLSWQQYPQICLIIGCNSQGQSLSQIIKPIICWSLRCEMFIIISLLENVLKVVYYIVHFSRYILKIPTLGIMSLQLLLNEELWGWNSCFSKYRMDKTSFNLAELCDKKWGGCFSYCRQMRWSSESLSESKISDSENPSLHLNFFNPWAYQFSCKPLDS